MTATSGNAAVASSAGGTRFSSGVRISHLAVGAALLTLCMDARANNPLYFAGLAFTGLIALAALLLPVRRAVYAFLIFLTLAPDLTQSAVDVAGRGALPSATIWQLRIGSFSGAWIVLAILTLLLVRLPRLRFSLADWVFVLYFGVVAVLVSFHFGFLGEDIGLVFTDARLPVFVFGGVLLAGGYHRAYPDEFPRLVAIAAVLFTVRAGVDLFYLLAGIERTLIGGDVDRISVDSAKGLAVIPAFFALYGLLERRRVLLSLSVFVTALLLVVAYQTRFLLVTTALGVLLVAALLRGRRTVTIVLAVPVLAYALVALLSVVMPDVARTAWVRLTSLRSESGSIQVDIDRYAAVVNTTRTLSRKQAWLTGMGYGAWYTDRDFRFITQDESAFDLSAYRTGRFPRVHDFAFHVLFKHGLLGIAAYLFLFVVPGARVFRGYRRAPPDLRRFAFVTIGATPTIVLSLFWTGKGLLIAGGTVVILRWLASEMNRAPAAGPGVQ